MSIENRKVVPAALLLASVVACTSSPGPQGDQGAQGPQGETGPQGAVGPQGLPGTNGRDGATAIDSETFATSADCPHGGVRIFMGLDTDGDGTLSDGERIAEATRELCNGSDGLPGRAGTDGLIGPQGAAGPNGLSALVRTTRLATSTLECPQGGVRLEAGVDTNGNGTLDGSEIDATQTRELCDGAAGEQGPQGIAGTSGTNGTNGRDGIDGSPGATGPQGPAGPQGPVGPAAPKGGEEPAIGPFGTLAMSWSTTNVTFALRSFRVEIAAPASVDGGGLQTSPPDFPALDVEVTLDDAFNKLVDKFHAGGTVNPLTLSWANGGAPEPVLVSTMAIVSNISVVPARVAGQAATVHVRFTLGHMKVLLGGAAFEFNFATRTTGPSPACTTAPALPILVAGKTRAPLATEIAAVSWSNELFLVGGGSIGGGAAGGTRPTPKSLVVETTPTAAAACAFSRMVLQQGLDTTILRAIDSGAFGPQGQVAEVELRAPVMQDSWRLSSDEKGQLRFGVGLLSSAITWRTWSQNGPSGRVNSYGWDYVANRRL